MKSKRKILYKQSIRITLNEDRHNLQVLVQTDKNMLSALREDEEFVVLFQRETVNASLSNQPVIVIDYLQQNCLWNFNSTGDVLWNKCGVFHRKTAVLASLFNKVAVLNLELYQKRGSDTGVFLWFFRNFYKTPPELPKPQLFSGHLVFYNWYNRSSHQMIFCRMHISEKY